MPTVRLLIYHILLVSNLWMQPKKWNVLPMSALLGILSELYALCLSQEDKDQAVDHYCSLRFPCSSAVDVFASVYILGLVSKEWNDAVRRFGELRDYCFVQRVEAVYYPNPRHINAKIRSAVLFQRYRICRTIDTECGDRGVFEAYDYGRSDGCNAVTKVIVKAWLKQDDPECTTENRVYECLDTHSVSGVPTLLRSGLDSSCGVYALVLEKLGPSLDDLLNLMPSRTLDRRMVLALAIQMLDRYEALHDLGIVHNGVKPANICLSTQHSSQLNLIDFGLSFFYKIENTPLPSEIRYNPIGNRQFLSIHGHLGITQSQRDDLESLGYLFSFLYHGYLPWDATQNQFAPLRDSRTKHTNTRGAGPHIWQIKIATPASVLFRDMDPAFLHFWKEVKSTAFGEWPAYGRLSSYFVQAWKAEIASNPSCDMDLTPGNFDWITIYTQLELEKKDQLLREEHNFRRLLNAAEEVFGSASI